MVAINILVGSTLGGTEYAAEAAQPLLEEAGFTTEIHFNPDLSSLTLDSEQIWLCCVATHGAGDYPENFKPFVEQLTQLVDDLSNVHFGLIGIGDSNYDTYCHAAKNLDLLLLDKGASRLGKLFTIDVTEFPIPEDQVVEWIPLWIKDLNNFTNNL